MRWFATIFLIATINRETTLLLMFFLLDRMRNACATGAEMELPAPLRDAA